MFIKIIFYIKLNLFAVSLTCAKNFFFSAAAKRSRSSFASF